MKYFAVFLLIGLASASFIDVLEQTSNDMVDDFILGMAQGPALKNVLGAQYAEEAEIIENDIKTELGKSLRETLDQILQKVRDAVDHGRKVKEDLLDKAREVAQKIKDLGLETGEKAKDLAERIREKAKEWLRSLLEKLGLGKRGITDVIGNLIGQIDFQAILEKVKAKIAEKLSIDGIIEYIKKIFGLNNFIGDALIDLIKTKGLAALKRFVNNLLPGRSTDYSIATTWENIREFLRGLGVQLKEKFLKFTEWLKVTVKEGVDNAKDKATKLRQIARETLEHSKTLSKEAAREALEFFRPYKEDLGNLWDELKETVARVIGRESL